MKRTLVARSIGALGLVAMLACQGAPPAEQAATGSPPANLTMFAALPDAPPPLAGNPMTPAKVELGKMLYFDPRLSRSWLISCNTCHNLALGGVDLEQTSIGHGWQRGPRNAPTVLNAVFNIAQFWDGRAKDLAEQAKGPLQASVEMSSSPDRVVETLKSIPEYVERFTAVFPDEADPVTFDNMAHAIEAFEATLLTPSRFDSYLRGDAQALAADEKAGLDLFVSKGCAGCHNGVNVGGSNYYPFGVVQKPGSDILPPGDKGRAAVTHSASDDYVFRAPTLRNVGITPPYFHSGVVWDLSDAVEVMGNAQLGMALTPDERTSIVTFLASLTGTQPKVEYPVLPTHTAATPRPVWQVDTAPSGQH
jgi:cytochrome c peroxidase